MTITGGLEYSPSLRAPEADAPGLDMRGGSGLWRCAREANPGQMMICHELAANIDATGERRRNGLLCRSAAQRRNGNRQSWATRQQQSGRLLTNLEDMCRAERSVTDGSLSRQMEAVEHRCNNDDEGEQFARFERRRGTRHTRQRRGTG
jgi:hypothetical protein